MLTECAMKCHCSRENTQTKMLFQSSDHWRINLNKVQEIESTSFLSNFQLFVHLPLLFIALKKLFYFSIVTLW